MSESLHDRISRDTEFWEKLMKDSNQTTSKEKIENILKYVSDSLMRDLTLKERNQINNYIKSISKPVNANDNFYELINSDTINNSFADKSEISPKNILLNSDFSPETKVYIIASLLEEEIRQKIGVELWYAILELKNKHIKEINKECLKGGILNE